MTTVSVRYIVNDVDEAIAFYTGMLGFSEVMHPAPSFAMLSRADLRLVLSAPGGGPGGGQAMPDGTLPSSGGWNRFALEVADLEGLAANLRRAGVRFRGDIVNGVGGKQIIAEDPSGNPVELFEPTIAEAKLSPKSMDVELQSIGWVHSTITNIDKAPNQAEGAPPAWIEFESWAAEASRDLQVGDEVILLTWLDRSDRRVMTTYPEDDQRQPLLGVFSTRSPDRPNPIGLHRAEILRREAGRILVSSIEVLDQTPVLDVKPVLDAVRER